MQWQLRKRSCQSPWAFTSTMAFPDLSDRSIHGSRPPTRNGPPRHLAEATDLSVTSGQVSPDGLSIRTMKLLPALLSTRYSITQRPSGSSITRVSEPLPEIWRRSLHRQPHPRCPGILPIQRRKPRPRPMATIHADTRAHVGQPRLGVPSGLNGPQDPRGESENRTRLLRRADKSIALRADVSVRHRFWS